MSTSGGAVLVDANLLIWAHHRQFPQHPAAYSWWGETLTLRSDVAIPWVSILAFLRISTHPRALEWPLLIADAWGIVHGWLDRSNVRTPGPGADHPAILGRLLTESNAAGNHTTDAHLASLAIEWGLELVSADRDFARYPGLRWSNPLA